MWRAFPIFCMLTSPVAKPLRAKTKLLTIIQSVKLNLKLRYLSACLTRSHFPRQHCLQG